MKIKDVIIMTAMSTALLLSGVMSACSKAEEVSHPIEEEPPVEEEQEPDKKDFTLPMALFTEPEIVSQGKESRIIMDELIKCIDASVEGSSIHVSVYLFNYVPLRSALANAHNRNVRVNVMIDDSKESSQSSNFETIKFLEPILKGHSQFIKFNNDVSSTAINHHKYVLFSEIKFEDKTFKDVVFSTSANFTVRETKFLEDAVVISHSGLYNAAKNNWEVMHARTPIGMKDFEYDVFESKEGGLEAHFFPRRKEGVWDGHHTVMELLESITQDMKDITVRIGMSMWSDANDMIADKLLNLQEEGARIEIISRATDNVGDGIKIKLNQLEGKGGYIYLLNEPGLIHSKFTLIEGVKEGVKETYIMNGTLNFINPELKNNNNLLLVLKNSEMYQDYIENFNRIKATRK